MKSYAQESTEGLAPLLTNGTPIWFLHCHMGECWHPESSSWQEVHTMIESWLRYSLGSCSHRHHAYECTFTHRFCGVHPWSLHAQCRLLSCCDLSTRTLAGLVRGSVTAGSLYLRRKICWLQCPLWMELICSSIYSCASMSTCGVQSLFPGTCIPRPTAWNPCFQRAISCRLHNGTEVVSTFVGSCHHEVSLLSTPSWKCNLCS